MKNSFFFFSVLFAVSSTHAGLQDAPVSSERIAKSNNIFNWKIYKQLSQLKEDSNLFISPHSIRSSLAMIYAGATQSTESEIGNVCSFSLNTENFHKGYALYLETINSPNKNLKLTSLNRIWIDKKFKILAPYATNMKVNYKNEVQTTDFVKSPEESAQVINKWCQDSTQGLIKQLVRKEDFDESTRMVLVNAIYFKAKWAVEFEKDANLDDVFYQSEDKKIKTTFMRDNLKLDYFENEKMQFAGISYQDAEATLYVALPKPKFKISEIEKDLSNESVSQWIQNSKKELISLRLPKFKMSTEIKLKETLKSLGMPISFSDSAKFEGIYDPLVTPEGIKISDVIHQATVVVDENGTEAAAASAVITSAIASAPPTPKVNLYLNRPFIFFIIENKTKSILFVGRYSKPGV